jgi:hypothetical protein
MNKIVSDRAAAISKVRSEDFSPQKEGLNSLCELIVAHQDELEAELTLSLQKVAPQAIAIVLEHIFSVFISILLREIVGDCDRKFRTIACQFRWEYPMLEQQFLQLRRHQQILRSRYLPICAIFAGYFAAWWPIRDR